MTPFRLLALALTMALMAPAARAEGPPEMNQGATVLTAHPATFAIASALSAGSSVRVVAVQPAKLPASRLSSFLSGRGAAALREAAQDADAVVAMRSLWPDDPLYPHARRANIRIVEIDAGRPVDGALPGIAVAAPADDSAAYAELGLSPMPATGEASAPWLAPTSLGRMADVVAADLERLAPGAKDQIAANLAAMKRRLITVKTQADAKLAEAPSVVAVALSGRYGALASDLGLELAASITAAPAEWTPERAAALGRFIAKNEAAVVLLDAEPNPEVAAAIASAGARAVTLGSGEGEESDPVAAVERAVNNLTSAFASSGRP